jgi:ParB family chromosome partitioning protein
LFLLNFLVDGALIPCNHVGIKILSGNEMTLHTQTVGQQIPLFQSSEVQPPPNPKRTSPLKASQVKDLPVDAIFRNPKQPRIYFDPDAISELASNIAQLGLLQPITVRISPIRNGYELIAGERRLQAFKQLRKTNIPAIICNADDQQMGEWALSENACRKDLSDFEISLAIERAEKDVPTRKRIDLAILIGISRCALYRYLAFQELPTYIQEDLRRTPINMTNKTADELKKLITFYGQAGLEQLSIFWRQVLKDQLEAGKLPDAIRKALDQQQKPIDEQLKRNLLVGSKRVGSMNSDSAATTIRIDSKFIPENRRSALADVVQDFLAKL